MHDRIITHLLALLGVAGLWGCTGEVQDAPSAQNERTGVVSLFGEEVELTYRIDEEGYRIFGGDMVIGHESDVRPADSTLSEPLLSSSVSYLWPNRTVPYVIHDSISGALRDRVTAAIQHWNRKTVLGFTPRTSQAAYVLITYDTGTNRAEFGFRGRKQYVWLNTAASTATVIHELGHAVGLAHEHQRPDRPITVHTGNLQAGCADNFKVFPSYFRVWGPYDYHSIMHYSSLRCAKSLSQPAFSPEVGESTGLSNGDIWSVNQLYTGACDIYLASCPSAPGRAGAWFDDWKGRYSEAACRSRAQQWLTYCNAPPKTNAWYGHAANGTKRSGSTAVPHCFIQLQACPNHTAWNYWYGVEPAHKGSASQASCFNRADAWRTWCGASLVTATWHGWEQASSYDATSP